MKHRLKPLVAEYLHSWERSSPLLVESYGGCVTQVDSRLLKENIWAVIAVELIEHLDPEIVQGFSSTVFGVLSPPYVIITTPNKDFNEVFKLPADKFRHWDHRFEWTRNEFNDWCEKIVSQYPYYSFETQGICEGTEEQTLLYGCVSQMAIFRRVSEKKTVDPKSSEIIRDNCYSKVASIEYPFRVETRTPAEIILQELIYNIDHFSMTPTMIEEYEADDLTTVPLKIEFLSKIQQLPDEAKGLRFIK